MEHKRNIPREIAMGLCDVPPSALGGAIGGLMGAPGGLLGIAIGGAIGGIAGYVAGAPLRTLLLDETSSFWIVSGINNAAAQDLLSPGWHWAAILWSPLNALLKGIPNYMRVGSLLLWDTAGLGDPEEY